MSIISALSVCLVVGSLGLNMFNSEPQDVKKQTITKSQNVQAVKTVEETQTAMLAQKTGKKTQAATANNKHTTAQAAKPSGMKVQGLNRIILTEAELLKIGIYIDEDKNCDDKLDQYVGYVSSLSYKSVMYMRFFKNGGSMHIPLEFPLPGSLKVAAISPSIITSYDGTVRMGGRLEDEDISEFISFHKELGDFFGQDFKAAFPQESLPELFDKKINNLSINIQKYKANTNPSIEICHLINKDLSDLNAIVVNSISEYEKSVIKPIDDTTSYNSTMTVFVDNPEDTIHNAGKEQMAKLGVRVLYERQPVRMFDVVAKRDQKLAETLKDMQDKVQSHIMFSKMIAVEIPFKDDSDNDGLIFWFTPSDAVLNALPERVSKDLRKEFKELQKNSATCGAPIKTEQTYMDIWRACDGAIENLRIFPNPVQDEVNLKLELKESRELRISIHDLAGSELMVISNNQSYPQGEITTSLNLSSLKTGMYLLVVSSPNGEKAMQRVIKK